MWFLPFLFDCIGHSSSQVVVISYEPEARDMMMKLKDKVTKFGYQTVMNDDQQGKSL